jgi:hypothetical protein
MKSMKCRLILVLLVLAVLSAVSSARISPVRAEPPRFSIVAPGIAHAIFEVRPADATPFSGHAFKIDLDVAELRLVPAGEPSARRTVEQIVASYPVVVAVNASFFDKEGRAMGLAVDAGRMMALSNRRSWGALVIDGKQGRILLGADIQDPLDHRLIVQGIPRLLVGGKVQQLKPQIAERTAVWPREISSFSSFRRRPKRQPSHASLPIRLTRAGSGAGMPSTSTGVRRHSSW